MALKDWKKEFSNSEAIMWTKGRKGIMIVNEFKTEWNVRFPNYILRGEVKTGKLIKSFKSKLQALKFAKEYMRTH